MAEMAYRLYWLMDSVLDVSFFFAEAVETASATTSERGDSGRGRPREATAAADANRLLVDCRETGVGVRKC